MSARAEDSSQGTVPWWLVLIEGIALIIIGVLFFVQPAMTAVISVQLLGIYWIFAGIFAIVRIFLDRTAWGWNLFLGILGIVAGLLVINNPVFSALIVGSSAILLLGIGGIIIGIVNIIQAFRGEGWGVGLLGAVSIILGVVLLMNRAILTIALPTTLGILAVIGGILAIIAAFRQRSEENRRVEAAVAAYKAPAEPVPAEAAAEEEAVEEETPVGQAEEAALSQDAKAEAESATAPAPPMAAAAAVVAEEASGEIAAEEAESEAAPEEVAEMPDTPGEQAKFHKKLSFVEGIGEAYSGKLAEAGVETTHDLLEQGSTRKGRSDLAEQTGISHKLIMKWVNHVDLYRVPGIGAQYADLLEASGVDTVPELAQRNPENLYNKMVEVNAEKKLVREVPGQHQVEGWVAQAKELPRKITY